MKNKYCGEVAYTSDIAMSYEVDRQTEDIWNIEQAFVRGVAFTMPQYATILDIPVGTGRFLDYYQNQKLNVYGVDISEAMLAEARGKVFSDNVTLEAGDARFLKFGDKNFDFVICWRLLHLLPQEVLEEVVRELARVAIGRLYFQAYVKDSWHLFLKAKNICYRLFLKRNCSASKIKPWSHIQSYHHQEKVLFKIFSENGLVLKHLELLGEYGSLRIKVYVLEKQ